MPTTFKRARIGALLAIAVLLAMALIRHYDGKGVEEPAPLKVAASRVPASQGSARRHLTEADRQAVFALLGQGYTNEVRLKLEDLLMVVAPADIPALTVAIAGMPHNAMRNYALRRLLADWMFFDRQAATAWAMNLPQDESYLRGHAVAILSGYDTPLAISLLDQLQDASARSEAIQMISRAMFAKDRPGNGAAEALRWLAVTAQGADYYTAANYIFDMLSRPPQTTISSDGWVEHEGNELVSLPKALALLDLVSEPVARQTVLATIATNWSKADPAAALAWAQGLSGEENTAAVGAVLDTWAKSNPAAAAAFLENTSKADQYLSAAPAIAQSLAATDPTAALKFADSLPEGRFKNKATGDVLMTMAKNNFNAAWDYAITMPLRPSQGTAMVNLVRFQAEKNPAQAALLLAQVPAALQVEAIAKLAAVWVKQDPPAFTTWLNTLPAGDLRDAAIIQLVGSIQTKKDLAGVQSWVNVVSNPAIKANLLRQLSPDQ